MPEPAKDAAGESDPVPRTGQAARARRQLVLGIAPLAVIALGLLVLLAAALPNARAPLTAATQTANAEVVESGVDPEGRGIEVSFTDADGNEQTGILVLARPEEVPVGAEVGVQYDPDDPGVVYAEGDAAHLTVRNLIFGIVWVALALLICAGMTAFRLISRPRLRRRPATSAKARRVRVRRGLSDRSWLVLEHGGAQAWVPVYWDEAVAALRRDTSITVHGDPRRDRVVLPVIDGSPIWPSGGRRGKPPKGEAAQPPPQNPAEPKSMLRQVRADAATLLFAPVFGLLWAYTDDSGVSGFLAATAVSAGVLFWLPSIFGSDPTGPRDDG